MLYDRTPEIDFAADTAIGVAYLPQVLTVLCPINTACAFPMRDFVGDLGDMGSSGRDAAPRLKAPTGNHGSPFSDFSPVASHRQVR